MTVVTILMKTDCFANRFPVNLISLDVRIIDAFRILGNLIFTIFCQVINSYIKIY